MFSRDVLADMVRRVVTRAPQRKKELAKRRMIRAECERLEERRLFSNSTDQWPGINLAYDGYGYDGLDCIPCQVAQIMKDAQTTLNRLFGSTTKASSGHPVRYSDGVPLLSATDLSSDGFGFSWAHQRTWSSNYVGPNGNGWLMQDMPQALLLNGGASMVVIGSAGDQRWFDSSGGVWTARAGAKDTLVQGTNQLTFKDSSGDTTVFFDFGSGNNGKEGQIQSFTDAGGHALTFTYTGNNLTEITRQFTTGSVTTKESILYSYLSSGANSGLLSNVTLRRKTWDTMAGSDPGKTEAGTPYTLIRQVDYTYYDGTTANGNLHDLESAVIKDPSGATIDTNYYRYYTADTYDLGGNYIGFKGGIKFVFSGASYDRARAFLPSGTPLTAADSSIAAFADNYFQYDTSHRVKEEIAQAAGCSNCSGGQGMYTYAYSTSTNTNDYNAWKGKTIETLPDGNTNTVYTDYAGQVMLSVLTDTTSGAKWGTYYRFDANGRQIWQAEPSAVALPTTLSDLDMYSDLMHNMSGNYQFLLDGSGLIEETSYSSGTTATTTAAGGVDGYVAEQSLMQGELGTAVHQEAVDYIAHSDGATTIYTLADDTVYRNANGTGAETTAYTYLWFGSTNQPQYITKTLPAVTAAENGPGGTTNTVVNNDAYGRPIWTKDANGTLNYFVYDVGTGSVMKSIVDVNVADTSDFANLPSGWTTPFGGGLELITWDAVDGMGRSTKETDPDGNVTYTVYNDPNHEMRVYRGWNSTTHVPTGPIEVTREYRPTANATAGQQSVYEESLTSSATPSLDSNNLPTGTETINAGNIQSLYREISSAGGQTIEADDYVTLSGQTYAVAPASIGAVGTNFYSTATDYDLRGRVKRVDDPLGTITRYLYDARGLLTQTWIGTDDTPTSGSWSPTNTAGTDLVEVTADEYDGGSAGGDGNLTKVTDSPGGSASARVTQYFYDWRERIVAAKGGVQSVEATSVHRPIIYYSLDNLGEQTATYQYDGDGVSIVDANSDGVPDQPSASLLRAESQSDYDELGRVYESRLYSVNASTGAVATNSLKTDTWYDKRGDVIKTLVPGGFVKKNVYDGAERLIKTYSCDGGGDHDGSSSCTWSDAGNLSGDAVLEETDYLFDADGNLTLTTEKQRFDDETATGVLGNPTTSPKARVSYDASFYDAANRPTADVNVGTNGGSSYTLPGSAPSRSDTVLVNSYNYDAAGNVQDVTDPKGLVTRTAYDLLHRATSTDVNYVDGTPSDADDQITRYTYDGLDHILTQTADMPGVTNDQVTQYVYGVTSGGGSDITSNDLLKEVDYPNKTTAGVNTSDKEAYTYNALGDVKTDTDRDGSVHAYTYDVLSRMTADAVTTLGSGVDGTVLRKEIAYNTQGQAYLFTTYNSATAGSVVGQVQRAFNGLGQMTTEYQQVSGSVNTSTSPKVQYAYTEMASGVNNSRQTSMTYPSGRILRTEYTTGVDASISRPSFIADDASGSVGTHLEEYKYLGLSTVVARNHPEPGLNLSYISPTGGTADAGDKYVGLDRFGRVADQRWIDVAGSGGTTDRDADRFQYTYDRDSNVTTRDWSSYAQPSAGGFDEAYFYDNLNRLTKMNRGNIASGAILDANATYARQWDNTGATGSGLDALGNWKGVTTDSNGGTAGGTTTTTHSVNSQNQLTAVSGSTSPVYDNAGNMTTDETNDKYTYDAWGNTIKVKNSASTDKVTYTVDALGRRVAQTIGAGGVGTNTQYYFSNNWQILQENQYNGSSYVAKYQTVFSPVYVDGVVERDNIDATAAGALDTSFNTTGKYVHSLTAGVDGIRYVQQLDGKIVGAGTSGGHVGVVRLNADGTLDTSFDGPGTPGNGAFVISVGTADTVLGLAVQDDGKIVLIGSSDGDVLLIRLNADGSYDSTFNGPSGTGGGKFKLDYSGATDAGWSVAIQPDGKIVFSGVSGGDVLVGRLTTSGAYDTSFNTVGWRKDDLGGTDRGLRVAVDHNGLIVVAGDTTAGANGGDIAIERYTAAGALDTAFNTTGKVITSLSAGADSARGMMIDDQNRILVAAYGDGNLDAVRYTQAGALDTTFNTTGKVSVDVSGTDQAESIVEDPYGRILLGGSSAGQTDFAVVRLKSDGTLDTSFDTDGKQTVSFSATPTATEIGYTMLVQPNDGRIIVAGLSDVDVAVARLGGGGIRSYLIQDANWNVTATADASGTIVDRYQYDPYGTYTALNPDFSLDLDGNGEVYQAYGFQGLRYDGNSGNLNARNRDLRPTLGSWIQADPSGYTDGANRYLTDLGSPGNIVDPTGLQGSDPLAAADEYSRSSPFNSHGYDYDGTGRNPRVFEALSEGVDVYNRGIDAGFRAPGQFIGGAVKGRWGDHSGPAVAGQCAVAFTPLAPVAALRDLAYDFTHPHLTWSWFRDTALDGLGAVPIVKPLAEAVMAGKVGEEVSSVASADSKAAAGGADAAANSDAQAANNTNGANEAASGNGATPEVNSSPSSCFVAGTLVLCSGGVRAIETITLGSRVLTSPKDSSQGSIEPAKYRTVRLHFAKDGQAFELAFLRPAKLFEGLGAGDFIDLSVMELEIRGRARILSIEPCPPIETGPGRIVTGAFSSQSVNVLQVMLQETHVPIRITGNHPVFSEDESGFVLASHLRTGERLRTRRGTAVVANVAAYPGRWQVFNLEVDGDHQYYVTEQCVLVHNGNGVTDGGTNANPAQKVHSQYPDGTKVYEGDQPGKITGPSPEAEGSPHTVLQPDANGRIYKAREYGEGGVPIKDIDFTAPTFPNGTLRPDHAVPEQHPWIPNNPNNPNAGYKRGPGVPLSN